MENNKKGLFDDKRKPVFNREDSGETTSQGKMFNNTKYVKKWDVYWSGNSTDINYSNNWKVGDTIEIVDTKSDNFGDKGRIILGFSKEPNMLRVELKNGNKLFVDKIFLKKISIYDCED
jgi:hypothetical protein